MALTGKGGVEGMMEDKNNIAELISLALIEDDGSRFKHSRFNTCETLVCKKPSIAINYDYSPFGYIQLPYIGINGIKFEFDSENDSKIRQAIEIWIINRAKEEVCYPRLSMMGKIKQFFTGWL